MPKVTGPRSPSFSDLSATLPYGAPQPAQTPTATAWTAKDLSTLKAQARAAQSAAVGETGDAAEVARAADGAGNHDGRVDLPELAAAARGLQAAFAALSAKPNPSPADVAQAQRMVAQFQKLNQLAVRIQEAADGSEELSDLAQKIDAEAHGLDGKRLGDGDGRLTRQEVMAFVRDRQARAAQAKQRGDTAGASTEQLLVALGQKLLE